MENKTVTLDQLAEKFNTKVWTKGNLKRIYIDAGWSTRKTGTTTFIWQDENGDFKVSCKIDCPSQPWQWIQSQEEIVKERVYNDIEGFVSAK